MAIDKKSIAFFYIMQYNQYEMYDKYNLEESKMKKEKFVGISKVGEKGQIVIPKEAREFFGIEPGDTLLILGKTQTGLIITKPETLDDLANQIFKSVENEE